MTRDEIIAKWEQLGNQKDGGTGMSNTEGMRMKFGMFKWEDAKNYLEPIRFSNLKFSLDTIELRKENDGKEVGHTYLVINTDEPYADEVIEIMKRHGHWG